MGQLRIGEGHPGNDVVVDRGRQPEQGAADDDAGVIVGDVGELRAADHVADGEHARVGGHEALVHLDAALVVLDAGGLEVEARRRWGLRPVATSRLRALDDAGRAALGDVHVDQARAAGDALDQRALADLDALRAQALQDHLGQLGIVLAQRLQRLEHGDAAAEPQVRLGQLQADRARRR